MSNSSKVTEYTNNRYSVNARSGLAKGTGPASNPMRMWGMVAQW